MGYSAFDLSPGGGTLNYQTPTASETSPTGGRWVNGSFVTPQPGFTWDANGQLVNTAQVQLAQQAATQAQQDLAGLGSPAQIASQAAGAADPFASQRGQYQNSLANLMNGGDFTQDPSYKARFEGGQQALERSAAAKGMLGSGNILQELQKYGQGMASQEFQNQYSRLVPLTGATTGSPAAAGSAIAATYGWRNNALANLGGAQQMQQGMPSFGGGGSSSLNFAGSGHAPFGSSGSGGGGGGANFGGGGGSFGGSTGFGLGADSRNLGTTQAESDAALRRQLGAGYTPNPLGGGGMINAVPTPSDNADPFGPMDEGYWDRRARASWGPGYYPNKAI